MRGWGTSLSRRLGARGAGALAEVYLRAVLLPASNVGFRVEVSIVSRSRDTQLAREAPTWEQGVQGEVSCAEDGHLQGSFAGWLEAGATRAA